jgi:hypothetical protein
MPFAGRRNSIDESSSADLRIPCTNIGDEPWDQLRLIRLGKWSPRWARIRTVDGNFWQSLACRPCRGDTASKLAGEVEKKRLRPSILMSLRHAVLVVTQMLEVRALLGSRHGGRCWVDAKAGNEGQDWRVRIGR